MTDTPDLAIDPAAEHDAEAAGCETHSHHGYMKEKDRYKARLKRIEGQVRGIHRRAWPPNSGHWGVRLGGLIQGRHMVGLVVKG